MSTACPMCGQVVAPRWLISFPPVKQRIFECMMRRKRGVSIDQLVAAAYGESADGGPANARKVVHVHISRMNRELARHGLRIAAGRGCRASYALERI